MTKYAAGHSNAGDLRSLVASRRLVVTAGSGGVGKTTTAAALGLLAAEAGRRVAVVTIDPARRLADALGLGPLTGELRTVDAGALARAGVDLAAGGRLSALMLDTRTTADAMVRRFAPDPETAQRILENTYYRFFSTSLAGAQEYMAVEQVRTLAEDPDLDLIVLDTPPASHALEFLDAPGRMLSALDSPALALLRAPDEEEGGLGARLWGRGRTVLQKSLNLLTGGPFLEELATFLGLFTSILDGLRAGSEQVGRLLRSPEAAFLLVSAPARNTVDEAIHFRHALSERGLHFDGFVINRVHRMTPALTDGDEALARALVELGDLPLARRLALVERMRSGLTTHIRLAERDAKAVDRLAQAAGGRTFTVPLLPTDVHDLRALHRVARWLVA